MGDFIVLAIIAVLIIVAVLKIYSDRKNGVKCSGCPHSKVCDSNCSSKDNTN
ncbi:MAG: FeoB-associated Cys-rich membrane protein [Lachnospirales bacterium]